jgi:Fe-Mn family superoxide dismutase
MPQKSGYRLMKQLYHSLSTAVLQFSRSRDMPYRLAPLYCRPWTLNGITPRLIESHYEHNYGGAFRRLCAVTDELKSLDPATAPADVIGRLKRDESTLLNSMLLHELYFAGLGGDGRAVPGTMASALERDFGSVDRWRQEFIALASALSGDAGWVLLSYLPRDGRLINHSATDSAPAIAGSIPLLALDMYEHAYHLDFGANATAYIASFMRNIDWQAVQGRYEDAVKVPPPRPLEQKQFANVPSVSVEDVAEMLKAGKPVQIVDARPRHYATKSSEIMAAAVWRDPERVEEWIGELVKDQPVVTYCVYGFHIGCETAATLREAGFDASYMAGGHFAWKAIKGAMRLL